jgi:hypothetical protein
MSSKGLKKPVRRTPDAHLTPALLLARIRWDWVAAALALLLLAWLVTGGDWDFFPRGGPLETFYDAQAVSFLHGRVDVDPESIGTEAFQRDGKSYGYFGPTPALIRLPLQLVFPEMYGRWNCLSMLLASAVVIGTLLLLMETLERRFPPAGRPVSRRLLAGGLLLAAAIGSTNFFVSAERKVYQEAIVWGAALAFAQAVFLARYLFDPKTKWLALSCAAAFLAFFARVSSGAGSLLSLAIVDLAVLLPSARFRSFFSDCALPRRAAAVLSATLIVSAALWAGLNQWKFGAPFTTLPVASNRQFNQQRTERVRGELASFYNLPITFWAYLSPSNIDFEKRFPWVLATDGDPTVPSRFPKAHFDSFEPFVSLPAGMPELLLAALAGTALCFGRRPEVRALRAPLAGALVGCSLIFLWGVITYRYLHDAFPWLVLGSAVSLAWLISLQRRWLRRTLAGLFAAATVYAVWINFAVAMVDQRYLSYPIPAEKRVAFTDLCDSIDLGGVKGFLRYAWRWRRYLSAASFEQGNLMVDRAELVERDDVPVVRSQGQSPNFAEYVVSVPAEGRYEIAVRYAAAQPQPVHLLVNRQEANALVCGAPTGGWRVQEWNAAGVFRLAGGVNRIGLASYGPVPPISMLRITAAE